MNVNRLRKLRIELGFTQAELAERAGISRTAVTAIEGDQLVPSVLAAISLAKVLDTSVEKLFGPCNVDEQTAVWAWEPAASNPNYWEAEVASRRWRYPASSSPTLTLLPDGGAIAKSAEMKSGDATKRAAASANETLVVACCDPAMGLVASHYALTSRFRMLALQRSSREALDLLRQGKVHAAGIHFSTPEMPTRNEQLVRETLGRGYQLLQVATWEEGIATASSSRIRSVAGAISGKLTWVGRDVGSAARECFERLKGSRSRPRYRADSHHGVAEAVRSGWADAGICVRLASEEAGLRFLTVQQATYQMCIRDDMLADPRLQSLLTMMRSASFRERLESLPGNTCRGIGELSQVK